MLNTYPNVKYLFIYLVQTLNPKTAFDLNIWRRLCCLFLWFDIDEMRLTCSFLYFIPKSVVISILLELNVSRCLNVSDVSNKLRRFHDLFFPCIASSLCLIYLLRISMGLSKEKILLSKRWRRTRSKCS